MCKNTHHSTFINSNTFKIQEQYLYMYLLHVFHQKNKQTCTYSTANKSFFRLKTLGLNFPSSRPIRTF